MDQKKPGLFTLFLKDAYEEAIQVDVVKMKRGKIIVRLNVLKEQFEKKDHERANFMLLDICDKILNDPYSDEYNMRPVEIDIIVFSSAVMNVSIQYYDRAYQIIGGLIMKYRNPVFYYVLGVSYFYRLLFQEARKQFSVVISLLGDQKNTVFLWPDTNVLIITATAEKIRENALFFLKFITLAEGMKLQTNKPNKKEKHSSIDISHAFNTELDMSVGIGKYLLKEIYPHVQAVLANLIKFDESKLPAVYRGISKTLETDPKLTTVVITNTKKTAAPSQDKTKPKEVVNVTANQRTDSKTTDTAADQKKNVGNSIDKKKTVTTPDNKADGSKPVEKSVSKKSQLVQTQTPTKSKQVQTITKKCVSQCVQTVENMSGESEKNKLISELQETIANLRMKLNRLSQKQKETEEKFNVKNVQVNSEVNEKNELISQLHEIISNLKVKNDQLSQKQIETEDKLYRCNAKDKAELIEKNRLITEQQEIISDLKLKLNNSMSKQKQIELKFTKSSTKMNELCKTNKTILAESEKYKQTITELRNLNDILEKRTKNVTRDKEEARVACENLFYNYRESFYIQIQVYENFKRRCESVLGVLNNIKSYLTEITVPTIGDCQAAIGEWLSAMLSCAAVLQSTKREYQKYDGLYCDKSLIELSLISPLLPIKEPNDIILESMPILVYTLKDFETMLQNSHSKGKKEKGDSVQPDVMEKKDFNGETDYRKKCNFIHKSDEPSASSESPWLAYEEAIVSPVQVGLATTNTQPNPAEEDVFPSQAGCETAKNTVENTVDVNKKKFKKLFVYLKQNIPHRTETEISEALNTYRRKSNGSLSGMTLHYILYNVLAILETPQTAWAAVKSNYKEFENDDGDMCPICIEPIIGTRQKYVLNCRHVYHTECIREWLSRNRVCAVCRMYTVLDEDFPPLKT